MGIFTVDKSIGFCTFWGLGNSPRMAVWCHWTHCERDSSQDCVGYLHIAPTTPLECNISDSASESTVISDPVSNLGKVRVFPFLPCTVTLETATGSFMEGLRVDFQHGSETALQGFLKGSQRLSVEKLWVGGAWEKAENPHYSDCVRFQSVRPGIFPLVYVRYNYLFHFLESCHHLVITPRPCGSRLRLPLIPMMSCVRVVTDS